MAVTKRVFRQAVRVGSLDGIAFENRAAAQSAADMANLVVQSLMSKLNISEASAEEMVNELDPSTIEEFLSAPQQAALPQDGQTTQQPVVAKGAPAPINFTQRLLAALKPKSRKDVLATFYGPSQS